MFISSWLKNRNSSGDPEEFRLSLVEHLDELRVRLIRCLAMLTVVSLGAWFVVPELYLRLSAHVTSMMPKGFEFTEILLGVTDGFMLRFKLTFMVALLVCLPFLVLQIWGFVEPGLKPHEKKPFRIIGPSSVFLFILGVYFAWLVLPTTIQWFVQITMESFQGIKVTQEAGRLVFFVMNLMLAFGICFQLPLIVFFLAAIGLLSADTLKEHWRQAVVVIFFVAAIATPSNDPLTMLMMAIPLCFLFMVSVLAVRITYRNKPQGEKVFQGENHTELDETIDNFEEDLAESAEQKQFVD